MQSKNPVYYEDRIAHLEEQKPMMVDNEVDGDNIQNFEKKKRNSTRGKMVSRTTCGVCEKKSKKNFCN